MELLEGRGWLGELKIVNIFICCAELLFCIGFICLICNLKIVVSSVGSIFSEMLTTFFLCIIHFILFLSHDPIYPIGMTIIIIIILRRPEKNVGKE